MLSLVGFSVMFVIIMMWFGVELFALRFRSCGCWVLHVIIFACICVGIGFVGVVMFFVVFNGVCSSGGFLFSLGYEFGCACCFDVVMIF